MAQATIRVKMDFSFDLMHETENEDQLVDFVIDSVEFQDKATQRAQEEFQVLEATYEELEPEESDADN